MTTAKDNGTLSEIRDEYKLKKKQLNKYNTFLDRHQAFVVFMPLLLALIGLLVIVGITSSSSTEPNSSIVAKIVGIISLVLLFAGTVMAFVTGGRKSANSKIEKQLADLKDEAVAFQKHTKEHGNVTRDELGLWRDVEQGVDTKTTQGKGGWILGVIVIVVIASFITYNRANNAKLEEATRQAEQAQQQKEQQEAQDRYYQQQRDTQESYERSKVQQCVSTGVGSSVYTNCY